MSSGHAQSNSEGDEQRELLAIATARSGVESSVQAAPSLIPLLYFFVLVAILLVAHQGERMSYAYPVFALAFAAWCLRRHPKLYITFTFFLYLLTPLVRRLADLGSFYHDPSPILSAPLLASLLCIVVVPSLLRRLPHPALKSLLPFGLASLGVFYGLGIGLLKSPPSDLIRPGLEWMAPLVFGAYCAAQAVDHDVLSWVERFSIVAIMALNLYGLVQFFDPMPWDLFWLSSFNQGHLQSSFGQPAPMQIRLFSMLNAPQAYAAMIAFTMPLLLTLRSNVWSLVAVPLTLLCLFLTQSRSQFFSVALALPMVVLFARSKGMLRVGLVSGIILLALSVGAVSGDMLNKVTDRLDTFSNLRTDQSAVSRRLGMALAIKIVMTEPFGQGLGFTEGKAFDRTELVTHYGIDAHDFGVVEVGLCFGYMGGSLFLSAFIFLLYQTFRRFVSGSAISLGIAIAIFSSLASMATVNLFLGSSGIWLWTVLGCAAVGRPQQSSLGWFYRRHVPQRKDAGRSGARGSPMRRDLSILPNRHQRYAMASLTVLSWVLLLLYAPLAAQSAVKSETFVDSAGINVHLHYTDTNYFSNFPAVLSALEQLHIRHVRDGLLVHSIPEYAARYQLLAAQGIRADFITNPDEDSGAITAFAARFSSSLELLEAPNEWDSQKDKAWAATLRRYLPMLYATGERLHIPVIGPSLVNVQSYATLGDVTTWEAFGNLHNYPGGRNPGTAGWGDNGYGSLAANLRNVAVTSHGLPVMTTEIGYDNDPATPNYVPEDVSAVYLPRLLLNQFLGGIRRTYLYELLSSGHEDFGLLSPEAKPKPGFYAVAALLALADDHDRRPQADVLPFSVTTSDSRVRYLLLQKSDGRYLLALWIEAPVWDVPHRAPIQVNDELVTLHLPVVAGHAIAHHWQRDGNVRDETVSLNRDSDLKIGSLLTVLDFRASSSLSRSHSGQTKGKM